MVPKRSRHSKKWNDFSSPGVNNIIMLNKPCSRSAKWTPVMQVILSYSYRCGCGNCALNHLQNAVDCLCFSEKFRNVSNLPKCRCFAQSRKLDTTTGCVTTHPVLFSVVWLQLMVATIRCRKYNTIDGRKYRYIGSEETWIILCVLVDSLKRCCFMSCFM